MKDSGDLANMDQMGTFSRQVCSADINIQPVALSQRGWTGCQRYCETSHWDSRSQTWGTATFLKYLGFPALSCWVFIRLRPLQAKIKFLSTLGSIEYLTKQKMLKWCIEYVCLLFSYKNVPA